MCIRDRSNAGGLGIIGAGGAPASWVKEQIVAAKKEMCIRDRS